VDHNVVSNVALCNMPLDVKEERRMKYKRIECKDGFSMSVQAGTSVYSDPRDDVGPYHSVECGFPSEYEELIIAYAEARHEPTKTVYGWVPVGVVTNVIAKHGGMIGGTVPEGVAPLKGSESD
jgi:hypothetical protein